MAGKKTASSELSQDEEEPGDGDMLKKPQEVKLTRRITRARRTRNLISSVRGADDGQKSTLAGSVVGTPQQKINIQGTDPRFGGPPSGTMCCVSQGSIGQNQPPARSSSSVPQKKMNFQGLTPIFADRPSVTVHWLPQAPFPSQLQWGESSGSQRRPQYVTQIQTPGQPGGRLAPLTGTGGRGIMTMANRIRGTTGGGLVTANMLAPGQQHYPGGHNVQGLHHGMHMRQVPPNAMFMGGPRNLGNTAYFYPNQNAGECRWKVLFANNPALTEHLQREVRLLLHARTCQIISGSCTVLNCCDQMKYVANHIIMCNAGDSCCEDYCSRSLWIMTHWKNCTTPDCPVGLPFLKFLKEAFENMNDPNRHSTTTQSSNRLVTPRFSLIISSIRVPILLRTKSEDKANSW